MESRCAFRLDRHAAVRLRLPCASAIHPKRRIGRSKTTPKPAPEPGRTPERSRVQPARESLSLDYASFGSATASPRLGCTPHSPRAATLRSTTHRSCRSGYGYVQARPSGPRSLRSRCVVDRSCLAPCRPRLRRSPVRVIFSSSPSVLTLINALAFARP